MGIRYSILHRARTIVNKELRLELCPCCDCSTIEGESELSTSREHRAHIQQHNIITITTVILNILQPLTYCTITHCTLILRRVSCHVIYVKCQSN